MDLDPEAAAEEEHHLLDRAKAESAGGVLLPGWQRRRELESTRLEHAQWHSDQHGVRLQALAAAARVHTHALVAMLDTHYLPLQQQGGRVARVSGQWSVVSSQ